VQEKDKSGLRKTIAKSWEGAFPLEDDEALKTKQKKPGKGKPRGIGRERRGGRGGPKRVREGLRILGEARPGFIQISTEMTHGSKREKRRRGMKI